LVGLRCHMNDACIDNPCHPTAVCDTSPIDGSYTCICDPGMTGPDCDIDINECQQGDISFSVVYILRRLLLALFNYKFIFPT
jgi:hypothetical protein